MAQAIKSIRRISKKLQETFKTICYYTARHLSKSEKYKGQFLDEYKKIANKLRSDAKKTQVKDQKKHKNQKEKLKKQLTELKQKRKNEEKDKQQNKYDRERSSSRQNNKQKDKYEIKTNKKYEKQKQRNNRYQRYEEKAQPKKVVSYLQKQRELDFERDFDFNKPYHREPNYTIYEEEEDNIKTVVKKKKQQHRLGWNVKQMENIGSTHPQKYKIMKITEETSDFQDQNAPEKVPAIKPREPLTPYFLFLRYNRFSIAQSYPNIDKKRSFARVWKQLPEQQRATYQQEYRRSQQIYAKKLVQFYAVNPRSIEEKHRIREQIEKAAKKEPAQQKKQPNKRSRSKKKQEKQDGEYQPKQGKQKDKPQKRQPRKKKAEQ